MHVTQVELENIKSYAQAEYRFERGTTAIVGPNGAGKTTILEAISWALFDTLEYSKDDFLRRGAKKGSVRVTFESDLDERQYVVYRDTGNGYYIYDPGLGVRVAERKADVGAFLRQHLGIEPGTDLKALFASAIGVPQGSFTADFLRPASQRKASFDRLLKVEEYRESAERLRETVNLVRDRIGEVRERIAGAEGKLERYDEMIAERAAIAARARELSETLTAVEREIAGRERAVKELDDAEQRMTEARALADRKAVERDAVARRLQDLQGELAAAARAQATQEATAADTAAHLQALETLGALEGERERRDRLRGERESLARQIIGQEAEATRLAEAMQAAARARVAAQELEQEISEQEELERERERLRELRAQAMAARERLKRLDAELITLRAQHAQVKERLRAAESASDAPAQVERLESERLGMETELSRLEQAATARKHLLSQQQEATKEINRLQESIAMLDRDARRFSQLAAGAAQVAELETRARELSEQAARLRAEIARDERTLKEVKGGVCPILGDKCLSAREGQPLDGYFKDHLRANRAQLAEVEQESAQVVAAARGAREAQVAVAQLENARQQLARERALLTDRERALAAVERELAKLPVDGAKLLSEQKARLFGLDAELRTAREALLRAAELEPLRQRLQEIETEGKARREEREDLAAAAGALESLDAEIKEAERRLRALKDPRGRAAQLRAEAEREESLRAEAERARAALAVLEAEKRARDERLQEFKELEEKWMHTVAERDRTAAAYRENLSAQALAATLPARQAAVAEAQAETARLTTEAESARQAHESAAAAYDRERHATERGLLAQARERAATTSAQLTATREREEAIGSEISKLDEVRATLREEFRAKQRLEEILETTDFVRDVLKQAGPLVTESYLYNITIEANQLFREITGDAGRSLRWSRDYEIILEEGGHERSFANLSGGEQMAAALSVRLALLKQLSDIRLAFFDEPTINMDAERRERLAQQIGQITHFDQLFVISHDDTFEETVDHVVTVVRAKEEVAAASG